MKQFGELAVMAVNRGLAPLSMFVSFGVVQRGVAPDDFDKFMVVFAISQWFLAFGFQWQKNIAVKYWGEPYYFFSLKQLALFGLVVACGMYFVTGLFGGEHDVFAVLYVCLTGAGYVLGIALRMKGEIKTYVYLDTAGQVFRWIAAVAFFTLLASVSSIFLGLSFVMALLVVLFLLNLKGVGGGTREKFVVDSSYLKVAFAMIIFDMCAAGVMYLDRIFSGSSDYILSSSIGAQFVTVLLGALVSVMYPRLSSLHRSGTVGVDWWTAFAKYFYFVPLSVIASAVFAYVFAVPLMELIKPDVAIQSDLVFYHSIAQILHFNTTLLGVALILAGKNYVSTFVYLAAFVAMFAGYLLFSQELGHYEYVGVKVLTMLLGNVFLVAYVIKMWRCNVL